MRVAFAGTPAFALPALEALARTHELVGVLTQPDRPKGRGQQLAASPVKSVAARIGVPVAQPSSLRSADSRSPLETWRPDVLVVVAYGLILPSAVLAIPRLGCVNIHASLLPRWRGAAPIQRAILAGDAESGVSIMLMDEGLDTGPVLLQKRVRLGSDETSGSLHDRLASLGAEALIEALDGWSRGRLAPRPQPEEGATYAAKISKGESLVDWRATASEIERRVRAFNPWPVAETRLDGAQLRIIRARARQGDEGPPGLILGTEGDELLVACGQGTLALTEVQRPGKRPVTGRQLAGTAPLTGRTLGDDALRA